MGHPKKEDKYVLLILHLKSRKNRWNKGKGNVYLCQQKRHDQTQSGVVERGTFIDKPSH